MFAQQQTGAGIEDVEEFEAELSGITGDDLSLAQQAA
jgi:hypothetical protein